MIMVQSCFSIGNYLKQIVPPLSKISPRRRLPEKLFGHYLINVFGAIEGQTFVAV